MVFCPSVGPFFEDSLSGLDSFVDAFNNDVKAFLGAIVYSFVVFVSR